MVIEIDLSLLLEDNSIGRRDDRNRRQPPGDLSKYIGCHCKDCEAMRKHAKTPAVNIKVNEVTAVPVSPVNPAE